MNNQAAKNLRSAFSAYMTGVTVVTSQTAMGELVGFTANSFTSVSLNPPLLLVCPGKHLQSYSVFEQSTHFVVNILADHQEEVSNIFASSPDDRFEQLDWSRDAHGSPVLKECLASFSCKVLERHLAGDHMILIGEVLQFTHDDQMSGSGLGYCSNGYFSLRREQQAHASVSSEFNSVVGAIIEHNDQVLIAPESEILCVPSIIRKGGGGARSALLEHLRIGGLDVKLDQVYSVYEDPTTKNHYTIYRASATTQKAAGYGKYVPIDDINNLAFSDTAQQSMMHRYVTETKNQAFGLYIGDSLSGDIHPTLSQQE